MYSTCLFCNRPLGSNEVIEAFPVGRRLAFDGAKGRLWVVCQRCEKWNLSPFDMRWEALEDCERLFRETRKRVSTDNIGLARLDEGLELVRIGEPLRPEFAAWRYGDQFGRRRRKAIVAGAGIGSVVGIAVAVGAGTGVLVGSSWWIAHAVTRGIEAIQNQRTLARIPLQNGETLTVRGADLQWLRLLPGSDQDDLRLVFWRPTGEMEISGTDALNATHLLMPKVNRRGAGKGQVQNAVRLIEDCADPVKYLHQAARDAERQTDDLAKWSPRHVRLKACSLQKLPTETRLAIEMATNEENERAALAGELELLEIAWEEAERIAAIADKLAIPEEIDEKLAEMQEDSDRSTEQPLRGERNPQT